ARESEFGPFSDRSPALCFPLHGGHLDVCEPPAIAGEGARLHPGTGPVFVLQLEVEAHDDRTLETQSPRSLQEGAREGRLGRGGGRKQQEQQPEPTGHHRNWVFPSSSTGLRSFSAHWNSIS